MKASVLNYEKLIAAVLYMLKSCKKKKKKFKMGQFSKPASVSKKQTQTANFAGQENDKLLKKGHLYVPGGC